MQWHWQTEILEGVSREHFLHTIYVFRKLLLQEVEIEKSVFHWNVWMLRIVGFAG